ncbi:winged helix-turn-helix domain-containing protein [Streptomonospora alba]|nr:helix-turn-helix domain-containing protein [Streptomonospora alba]
MPGETLAAVAGVVANRTRAAFCDSLLDGRSWSLSQLADAAGVSLPTASEHATVLVAAGLCREHRRGRSRRLALADARVAGCLEELASLAGPRQTGGRTLAAVSKRQALARGRTCYDHLAGRLGAAITDALHERGVLDTAFAFTPFGREWFADHFAGPIAPGRRPLTRSCLDWTERRSHLAGAAGARVCTVLFERRWIERIGTDRAVVPTAEGAEGIGRLLGCDVSGDSR